MLLVPGHNRGNMGIVSLHIHKLRTYRISAENNMAAWKRSFLLTVAVVEVFLQEDLFHF